MSREIILNFGIPASSLLSRDTVVSLENIDQHPGARREVSSVVSALRQKGIIRRGDKVIGADLHIDETLASRSAVRKVRVSEVFSEDPNGKGSTDIVPQDYLVKTKKPNRRS